MPVNPFIENLKKEIEPYRQQIIQHKVYSAINDVEQLNIFMKYHVFAVWDFMSLLKSLQNSLTCVSIPWFPKGGADTRFLINEIVVGEESDVDMNGVRMSHFELYLNAMKQSGAEVASIKKFIEALQKSNNFQNAFEEAHVPQAARNFIDFTFHVIHSNKPHLQAATFTFGREDLIPGMFMSLIADIEKKFPDTISIFKYYLERHIEVDGDHHSHLALQMTSELCCTDPLYWKEATAISIASLKSRIDLWNGAYEEIMSL